MVNFFHVCDSLDKTFIGGDDPTLEQELLNYP